MPTTVILKARRSRMKGIDFVVDEAGDRKAVVIDLAEYGDIWEDFYDTLVAQQREREPRETLAEVKKRLDVSGD
ncbi:MAG TPA: hypothetical protein VKM72_10480 [Thermoanaerobaculia bacterium]|nr:hypothetical protein [Thermoanaerobaculia bacterium]